MVYSGAIAFDCDTVVPSVIMRRARFGSHFILGRSLLVDIDLSVVLLCWAVRAASVFNEAFQQSGESGDLLWMFGFEVFGFGGIGGEVEKLDTGGILRFLSGTWLAPPSRARAHAEFPVAVANGERSADRVVYNRAAGRFGHAFQCAQERNAVDSIGRVHFAAGDVCDGRVEIAE
jgi:hypothetical protein